MTIARASVVKAALMDGSLGDHLLPQDGQEGVCLATYRPSTEATRRTAVLRTLVPHLPGSRKCTATLQSRATISCVPR